MIEPRIIEEIFEAAKIEEVVGDFVHLKKRGVNYLGNCPFHNEKTPSFTVSPAKGIYKCFGCGAGGNSVNFIMEHEHYSYPEALKFLAGKYNIEIPEADVSQVERDAINERESLFLINKFASEFFENNLHNTQEGTNIGLSYLKERGLDKNVIESFKLGYSPENDKALLNAAKKEGYKAELLEKMGLIKSSNNYTRDFFRGRVIFPIHNITGRVIAFGARTLKKDKKIPKYLNSPETDIYNKSKTLYGLYQAKRGILEKDSCNLVEGYTDVISLHQSGITNSVASAGTSLTEDQIRLIKRYTNNITILYDGDEAGIKASFRGIDMILKEGLDVKVVLFPDGEDPDSFCRSHRNQEVEDFIKNNAKDFLVFKASTLNEKTKNDPASKTAFVNNIVHSLSLITDLVKSSIYTKQCSQLLNIDEQALLHAINKEKQNEKAKSLKQQKRNSSVPVIIDPEVPTEPQETSTQKDVTHQEKEIVRLLLLYGERTIPVEVLDENEEIVEIEVDIANYISSELQRDGIEFEHLSYKEMMVAYNDFSALDNPSKSLQEYFLQHPKQEICKEAINLISIPHHLSERWEEHNIFTETEDLSLKKTVEHGIFSLKASKVEQMIENIQKEIKSNPDENRLIELFQHQNALIEVRKTLNKELGRIII